MKLNFFVENCFSSCFENICLFGFFDLFIGVLFLCLNAYAFIQMTKYYRKLNFENTILLISFAQLILFLIIMILYYQEVIYIFHFLQISVICLINRKFVKLSRGFIKLKYDWINYVIIAFNIIYLISRFVVDILEKNELCDSSLGKYFSFSYYFIELMASILLTVYCCKFLNIIKQKLYKARKESKILQQNDTLQNSINSGNDNKKSLILFNFNNDDENGNEELFYEFKKKQLRLLFLVDIIATVNECAIDLCIILIDSKFIYDLFYYISCLISLFHVFVIFLSFYWIIRRQYNSDKRNNEDNEIFGESDLIDNNFIEKEIKTIETQNIKNEINKSVTDTLKKQKSYLNEDFD